MNFASGRNVAPAILHPNRSASVQEEFTMTKLRASFCTAALLTDAKARGKDESGSMVAIAFDKVELKGGRDLQFNGGIQAIGKPEQNAAAYTGGGSPMSESGGVPSGAAGQGGMGGARTGGAMGAPPSAGNPGNAPADSGVPASGGVGPLSPASQGVVGIQGLSLQDSAQASVITSSSGNVHLDSGTQLILRAK